MDTVRSLGRDFKGRRPSTKGCVINANAVRNNRCAGVVTSRIMLGKGVHTIRRRACVTLRRRLREGLRRVRGRANARVHVRFPGSPMCTFTGSRGLARATGMINTRMFKSGFILRERSRLFLSNSGTCECFERAEKLFAMFLTKVPKRGRPLRRPGFRLSREVLPCDIRALCGVVAAL